MVFVQNIRKFPCKISIEKLLIGKYLYFPLEINFLMEFCEIKNNVAGSLNS
jgi:hypothetical protein